MATRDGGEAELRRSPRVLGSLEARLMDLLWDAGAQLSGQVVCDRLGDNHNYKTVMTVLNRLVEKELLQRELDGRAYRYVPRLDRSSFLRSVADEMVRGYTQAYGEAGLPHLSAAVAVVVPPVPPVTPSAVPVPPIAPAPVADPPRSNATPIALLAGAVAFLEVLRVWVAGRRRRKQG